MDKEIEVTFGTGKGQTELSAFDAALFDAGIGNYNLLHLSSVIPTGHTPIIKKVNYNYSGEFGHKMFCVLSERRESRIGYEAWAGLGWVTTIESPTRGIFVEHIGESEQGVVDAITKSLTSMVTYRKETFGPIQHKVVGIMCEADPVCALVAAVYSREGWE